MGILGPGENLLEGALLSLLFFAIAIALPVCSFITSARDSRYRSLSLTALSIAIYAVSSSGLGTFLVSSTVTWPYLALISLFFIPAGICSFIIAAFPVEAAVLYLHFAEKIHIIFAMASLVSVAANVAPAPFFLKLFFILLIITLFLVFNILIRGIRAGNRHAEYALFGIMAVLGLGVLTSLSQTLQISFPLGYPVLWGLLILLASFIATLKLSPNKTVPLPNTGVASSGKTDLRPLREEKDTTWGNKISSFTHEVNTPLGTGLLSATHLQNQVNEIYDLFRNGELKKSDLEKGLLSYKEAADIIITNLQSASELVRTFKHETTTDTPLNKQAFNVDNCLRKVITGLIPRIRQAGHELNYSCPGDLAISSNPLIFSQIISNLVINSLTHAFLPDVKGDLTLEVSASQSMMQIIYSDNGKGMDKQLISNIFKPYFTTNSASGNSGLGLYVVHSLVTHRLGGSIECSSTPGQGTTFTIKLPIERR